MKRADLKDLEMVQITPDALAARSAMVDVFVGIEEKAACAKRSDVLMALDALIDQRGNPQAIKSGLKDIVAMLKG